MIFPEHQQSTQTPPRRFISVIFLICILLAVGVAGYFFMQNQQGRRDQEKLQQASDSAQQVSQFVTPIPLVSPIITLPPGASPGPDSKQPPAEVGMIAGTLSYPSEKLPKQTICAVDTTSNEETCTGANNGNSYLLAVKPGTYHVYAIVSEEAESELKTKAYYSEFVTCGLLASCPSHKPIEVVVATGATIKDIDPGDWYNQ